MDFVDRRSPLSLPLTRMRFLLTFPAVLAATAVAGAQAPEVARIVVSPAQPTMLAGDTLRLTAQAFDAAGKAIEGVRIRFQAQGGRFEGTVDSLGLVESGATGTLPVVAVAIVSGARPKVERFEVRMIPGSAASITPSHASVKLALGQRFRLGGQVFSRTKDLRAADRIAWTSSAPNVARVDQDGMVAGVRAGKATLTGTSGRASVTVPVEVVAAPVATLELSPGRADARQGDVQRFRVTAKDARGNVVGGLTTSWSFSPGEGAHRTGRRLHRLHPGRVRGDRLPGDALGAGGGARHRARGAPPAHRRWAPPAHALLHRGSLAAP